MIRTALASIAVVAWVLVVGSAADFGTVEAHTAFVLGIVAAIPGFLAGAWAEDR